MPVPELTPRLAAVAAHVLAGAPMADVGTDHAVLPVYLVASGRVPRAVASDRLPGPLAAARRTVLAAGVADRVDLRLGEGLAVLAPGEVACVTLAGMGGALMARILGARPQVLAKLELLVLQPNTGEDTLRRWLAGHGWRLAAEELVADGGRGYVVLVAAPGAPGPLTEADFLLGPHLRRRGGAAFRRYVQGELARVRRALVGAQQARRPDADKLAGLAQRVRLLEEALAE